MKTNSLLDQLKQLIDSLINTEHLSLPCLIVYAHTEFKISKQNTQVIVIEQHSQSHKKIEKHQTLSSLDEGIQNA